MFLTPFKEIPPFMSEAQTICKTRQPNKLGKEFCYCLFCQPGAYFVDDTSHRFKNRLRNDISEVIV